MALRAAHFFMHPAKRVTRAIVVKLGHAPDRFPTGIRVAIFAGDSDGAVGVPARFLVRLWLGEILRHHREGQHDEHEPEKGRCAHETL
jgi:hypothetical protein